MGFNPLCPVPFHRDSRAEPQRPQGAGDQAEGARGVPAAHLPPGGGAVRRPPRHPGTHAGERRHHGEFTHLAVHVLLL